MKKQEKSLLTPAAERMLSAEEVKKINTLLTPDAVRILQSKKKKTPSLAAPIKSFAVIPKTSDKTHPLFQAVEELKGDQVRQLLSQKVASANARNETGLTLLHLAVLQHRSIFDTQPTLDALLEYDADINATDAMGLTPLSCAALIKNYQLAHYLIARGARCDFPEKVTSPLYIAVMVDSLPIIRLLMKNGVDIQRYDIVRLAAGINDAKILQVDTLKRFLPQKRSMNTLEFLLDHEAPLEPQSKEREGELMSYLFSRYFDWKNTTVLPAIKCMILRGYPLDKGKLGSRPIDYILKSQMTEWKVALVSDKLIQGKIKELMSPENLLSTLQNLVSQPGYQKSDLLNMIDFLTFSDQCDLAIILINANLGNEFPQEFSAIRFIRPLLENLANFQSRQFEEKKENAFDRIIPYLIQSCDIDSIRIFLNSGNHHRDSCLLSRITKSDKNIEAYKSLALEKQKILLDFLKIYGIDDSRMKSRDEEIQEEILQKQNLIAHREEFDRHFAGFKQRMSLFFHPELPIMRPSINGKDVVEKPKPQIIIAPPSPPSADPNTLATPTSCYLFPAPPIVRLSATPPTLPPLDPELIRRVSEPQKVPRVSQPKDDKQPKQGKSLFDQFSKSSAKPLPVVAPIKETESQTVSPPLQVQQQGTSLPILISIPTELAVPQQNADDIKKVSEPQNVPPVPQQKKNEEPKQGKSLFARFSKSPQETLPETTPTKETKLQTLSPLPQAQQQAASLPILISSPVEVVQQPTRAQPQLPLQKPPLDSTPKPADKSLFAQFSRKK